MAALSIRVKKKAIESIRIIEQFLPVQKAYLFGSHVEGLPDQWSDIDIAIFSSQVQNWDLEKRVSLISRMQKAVGYDVEIHLFPADVLEQSEGGSFANYIISHGVQLDS